MQTYTQQPRNTRQFQGTLDIIYSHESWPIIRERGTTSGLGRKARLGREARFLSQGDPKPEAEKHSFH
jgi:hypothetical protein